MLVSIGAGVFVEKPVSEAAPIAEKQVEELKKQGDVVIQNISTLSQEADKLAQSINTELKAG